MKVRTFHVASMREAIRSIKETPWSGRRHFVHRGVVMGQRIRPAGGSKLEVMAAIEDDAAACRRSTDPR